MTDKEQITINTDKYFVEIIDESGGTISYTVAFPEKLLMEIIKQNKQLLSKIQECEELKSESFTREELIAAQEKEIECYDTAITRIKDLTEFSYRPYVACGEYNETCPVLTNILNVIEEINKKVMKEI